MGQRSYTAGYRSDAVKLAERVKELERENKALRSENAQNRISES